MNLKQTTHLFALAAIVLCVAHPSARGNAETSDLPIYPGATKMPTQMKGGFEDCGHNISVVEYETAANAKTVAKWYEGKIASASVVDKSTTEKGDTEILIAVMKPDGSEFANVSQSVLGFNARSQQLLGTDKTSIGLTTSTPPLGAGYIALESRAAHGDAATKAQLKAACPNG